MPLQATSGAASYDGFGGGVVAEPNYIESCFSTYLYTGNGSTQTITNGIDLATKGGMVWTKMRDGGFDHQLVDTARGVTKIIASNLTDIQSTDATSLTAFNTTGYTLGSYDRFNDSAYNYASWTFRKQPKFFDIVTYTGNGVARTISHNLGSVPGCIMVKRLSGSANNWAVYHRSLGNATNIALNLTTAATSNPYNWNSTTPTSTEFSLGAENIVNANGDSFVAYLFAHDAGGFGLTGTDNVISCGSYVKDGSGNATVNLGYEPQWIIAKPTSTTGRWYMYDNMRGMSMTAGALLSANYSNAESSYLVFNPTATGFKDVMGSDAGETYIYIAIRRGPMKVPTSGTSVFTPDVGRTDYVKPQFDSTFPVVDTFFNFLTNQGIVSIRDRLRGSTQRLVTYTTGSETSSDNPLDLMYGAGDGASVYDRAWMFSRAPKFHDVVCWTGTGSAMTLTHNLQTAPELILLKDRNNTTGWAWYYGITNKWISMPGGSAPFTSSTIWNDTAPTSSVFSVGADSNSNASGTTYVAYLWASLAGISKIGTYVGNGSSQTINCGFTSGARFVMVTNLTDGGRWQVVDTARGINSASDPVIRLDQNVAEITGEDPVDPDSSGFIVNVGGPDYTFINNSGTTYLYLAIA